MIALLQVFSALVPIAASGCGKAELYVISSGTVILQSGSSVLSTLHAGVYKALSYYCMQPKLLVFEALSY